MSASCAAAGGQGPAPGPGTEPGAAGGQRGCVRGACAACVWGGNVDVYAHTSVFCFCFFFLIWEGTAYTVLSDSPGYIHNKQHILCHHRPLSVPLLVPGPGSSEPLSAPRAVRHVLAAPSGGGGPPRAACRCDPARRCGAGAEGAPGWDANGVGTRGDAARPLAVPGPAPPPGSFAPAGQADAALGLGTTRSPRGATATARRGASRDRRPERAAPPRLGAPGVGFGAAARGEAARAAAAIGRQGPARRRPSEGVRPARAAGPRQARGSPGRKAVPEAERCRSNNQRCGARGRGRRNPAAPAVLGCLGCEERRLTWAGRAP